ncbi:MAG: glycosyltransferase [Burkholderiaceae bacterium]|nr:glycosyltransferase [Burkholderiaceae bacterium]
MPDRLKLLFFAEAVTLAHVARPVALARQLDAARYDIAIACAPRYARFAQGGPWTVLPLHSLQPERFNAALSQGRPVYDVDTLSAYVDEDRALIEQHRPDAVIGDFRLSLAVSARLAQVPYLAIANAYWTPLAPPRFPMPVLPLSRALPLPLARALFVIGRPFVFPSHCQPMNRLRQRHGLPGYGSDLRRVYSDADHLLLPDAPALFADIVPGAHASWIGPLAWAPALHLPPWWAETETPGAPWVYVTLGSSGPPAALQLVLQALADQPVRVMASTAGGPVPAQVPANARLADYLPGDAAAARAQLMVCNGGSLGTQQALAAGVPVLGLASNMDQFLNMAPIEAAGAGITLRTDRLSVRTVAQASSLLLDGSAHDAARRLQPAMRVAPGPAAVLAEALDRLDVSAGRRRQK